jgi:deoxyribonuclease V
LVAGCFICFGAPKGDYATAERAWAAASHFAGKRPLETSIASGDVAHPYEPGFLALREGRLLERAINQLTQDPEVLLVNATGRDHPRRAGLALHLGAALDIPTVGVTDRPLVADGADPPEGRGATARLVVDDEVVGYRLRSRAGARPICVHAAWRTDPDTALEVAMRTLRRARTPQPLRRARRAARLARAGVALADGLE